MKMSTSGKNVGAFAYLVTKLQKRALSRRQSVAILNFIFEEMKKQLARGREVEFPLGKLRRVRKHFGAHWELDDDWPANRQPYTVEWVLDDEDWRRLGLLAQDESTRN